MTENCLDYNSRVVNYNCRGIIILASGHPYFIFNSNVINSCIIDENKEKESDKGPFKNIL